MIKIANLYFNCSYLAVQKKTKYKFSIFGLISENGLFYYEVRRFDGLWGDLN